MLKSHSLQMKEKVPVIFDLVSKNQEIEHVVRLCR